MRVSEPLRDGRLCNSIDSRHKECKKRPASGISYNTWEPLGPGSPGIPGLPVEPWKN